MTPTRYPLNPVPFTEEYRPDLLPGRCGNQPWQGELYREEAPTEWEVEITAVPYCIWNNRSSGCVPEIGTQNEHYSHHSESG